MTECEDELICDLAETYHVMDYRELSPLLAATLCVGLREDSRVKMRISEQKISMDRILLMRMVDELAFLSWTKTKDANKGKNRPESILQKVLQPKRKSEAQMAFESAEAFENAWRSITGG